MRRNVRQHRAIIPGEISDLRDVEALSLRPSHAARYKLAATLFNPDKDRAAIPNVRHCDEVFDDLTLIRLIGAGEGYWPLVVEIACLRLSAEQLTDEPLKPLVLIARRCTNSRHALTVQGAS